MVSNAKPDVRGGWSHKAMRLPHSKWVTFSPCTVCSALREKLLPFSLVMARTEIDGVRIYFRFNLSYDHAIIAYLIEVAPQRGLIDHIEMMIMVHGRVLGYDVNVDDDDTHAKTLVLGNVEAEIIASREVKDAL
jgi:hypothetical protein